MRGLCPTLFCMSEGFLPSQVFFSVRAGRKEAWGGVGGGVGDTIREAHGHRAYRVVSPFGLQKPDGSSASGSGLFVLPC